MTNNPYLILLVLGILILLDAVNTSQADSDSVLQDDSDLQEFDSSFQYDYLHVARARDVQDGMDSSSDEEEIAACAKRKAGR